MTNPKEFNSSELTGEVFKFYSKQLFLLEKLYQYQFNQLKHMDDTRLGSLYLLLFNMPYTGTSIGILARHLHLNECYMLARSLLERIINYLFLLSCDEEEYQRYLSYTKQKGFRVLNRSFTVGDMEVCLRWSGSIDLEQEPELKKAVDTFTSKKGKPKTRWTSLSLSEMLESINNKGELDVRYLMFAILGIYDDASEALHGTLYGSVFHIGAFGRKIPSSVSELGETFNEQFSTLFLMLGTCVHTLLQGFHKVSDIENVLDESRNNLKDIKQIMSNYRSGAK